MNAFAWMPNVLSFLFTDARSTPIFYTRYADGRAYDFGNQDVAE